MADFPSIEPDLEGIALIANNQIYDSILTGETQTASLSGAKWQCTPTFSNRNGKEASDLRAFIFGQSGVAGRFNYYPASIDNVGTHAGLGVVDVAGQVGSELFTKDWDADQDLLFAAGDYLTVNGEMKMVTADVSVGQDYIEYDETNYMPSPFDPEGWRPDPDGTITNVTLANPSGASVAGLAEQVGVSHFNLSSSFFNQASFTAGDKVYIAIILKKVTGSSIECVTVESYSAEGTLTFSRFNFVNKTQESGTVDSFQFTDLTDGFVLLEVKVGTAIDRSGCYSGIRVYDAAGAVPSIGSQVYVQAAFFGKSDDWPAKLRANATIPITPPLRTSPADGALIEADNPYFPARLESDDQSTLQVSAPVIYNSTFSIVEAF